MFDTLTQKYKFIITLIGFLVLLITSYQLAIKSTIKLRRNYKELNKKYTEADELPKQIAKYQVELQRINQKYFKNQTFSSDNHELILEQVSKIASYNNVSIHDFPSEHQYSQSGVIISTHQIVMEGKFKNLIKTINKLEMDIPISTIKSLKFYTKKDRKTKQNYLFAHLFLQNYSNITDNEKND